MFYLTVVSLSALSTDNLKSVATYPNLTVLLIVSQMVIFAFVLEVYVNEQDTEVKYFKKSLKKSNSCQENLMQEKKTILCRFVCFEGDNHFGVY